MPKQIKQDKVESDITENIEKDNASTEVIELNSEVINKAFDDLQSSTKIFKLLSEKKNKKEFNFEDINVTSQKLNDTLNSIETLSRLSSIIVKYQSKILQKRNIFRKKDNTNSEPRKPSGFTKPMDVPDKFKEFFNKNILSAKETELKEKYGTNFNINDQHPRTTLTGIIFAYIRSKELYVEAQPGEKINKRIVKLDKPLKELFNVEDGEINGFKDFQKYMGSLYV